MKRYYINLFHALTMVTLSGMIFLFSSCNKDLPVAEPNSKPVLNPGATQTIADKITGDADYSIYAALLKRVGMLDKLSNPDGVFTVIAPKNDAFAPLFEQFVPGIEPDPALIALIPDQFLPLLQAVAAYSIIPGQQYLTTDATIAESGNPNVQLPTALKIGDIPGLPVPLEMSIFPSSANGFWINHFPVIESDQKFMNGVIQTPLAVVAPPSQLLRDAIYDDPDFSFFKAAVARADSDQTPGTTASFDFLLQYPVMNMTVLVPDNTAFQGLLIPAITAGLMESGLDQATALSQAQILAATPDVFENAALFPALTAEMVRGIIAYHIFSIKNGDDFQPLLRMFPNNFPKTPTLYTTLVNSSVSIHPGVQAAPVYTGPAITGMQFTGLGTFPPGGDAFSGEPAHAAADSNGLFGVNCVNGIYYKIDRVLLPQ